MKSESWLERALHLWPVKILSLAAAILLFFFTNYLTLVDRPILVPIHYVLPTGFIQGDAYPSSARITLRGVEKEIYDLSENDLQVTADLTKHPSEGEFNAELKVRRLGMAAAVNPLQVIVEPKSVSIKLEQISYKEVPIELKFSGSPAPGFEVVSQTVSKSMVRVGGPRARIDFLASVPTEEVDLSVHTSSFVQQLHVRSPDPLVKIISEEMIELRVEIKESAGVGTFEGIPLSMVGLDRTLAINGILPLGIIKIQSKQASLKQIAPENLHLIIDASGITTTGIHSVKVIPEVPSDFQVLQYSPSELDIDIGIATQEHTQP